MGSLSNLYISQSYQSLTHLGTNNALSVGTMTQLQDGIGQSLNISFDGTNISSSGNIYGANITASVINTGSLVTTSSFNSYTSSTNARLTSIETTTASLNNSVSALNTNSASVNISISALNTFTASQSTASIVTSINNLNTFTSSANVRLNNLETTSASVNVSISNLNSTSASQATSISNLNTSASLALITASLSGQTLTFTKGNGSTFGIILPDVSGSDITALNQFTASQLLINTGYNTFTSSTNTSISALNTFTASQSTASLVTSITELNTFSASAKISISALNSATSSYVTETESGSFLITASFDNGNRNLTFTKGDNTTFNVNIPDVSGSAGNFVTTSSFNAYTSSNDQRVTSLESNSASVNTSISNLNTFSQSAQISINSLNGATSSYANSASVALVDANQQSQINSLIAATGSYLTASADITALNAFTASQLNINTGYNTFTSSANQRLSSLETTSASVNTSISSLNTFTASQSTASIVTSINNLNTFSASALVSISNINSTTASLNSSVSQLNASSASQQISIDNLNAATSSYITESETASFARTNIDNNFTTNQTFTNITAVSASFTYLTTLYETASVIYSSGSNQFGDELTDVQTLSGSVKVQGSLTVNGTPVLTSSADVTGFVTTSSFNQYTSSNNQRVSSLESNSASVNTSITNINTTTASLNTSVTNLNQFTASQSTASLVTSIDNLNTFSASALVSISNLNASSASQQVSIDALNVFTASQSTASLVTSIDNLNIFSASALVSINNLNASSASQQISIDSLNSKTGSFATTGSNAFFGTNTFSGAVSFTGSAPSILSQSFSGSLITNLTDTYTNVPEVQQIVTLSSASYAALLSGSLTNSNTLYIVSGSSNEQGYVSNTTFNSYTSSTNSRLTNIETTTASLNISASLALVTASFDNGTRNLTFTKGDTTQFSVNIPDVSGSTNFVTTSSFNQYTQSNDQRVSSLETNSASVNISISNINSTTASLNTSVTNLNASSASQQVSIDALNQFTASQSTASIVNSITELNTFSASALVSISNLNASSASQQISIDNLNTNSASVNTSITNINSATASLFTSASLSLVTASFNNGTRDLTFTKGDNTTFAVNIPDVSGSAGTFVTTSSFNAYTQSNDQRVSSLEVNSASVNTSVININTFTQSANISINALNAATSSYATSAITASSLITASVSLNTITFTKGDGTTFPITVNTGSGGGTTDTGSLMVTGSVNVNVLTFTKGDGSTFDLTVSASGSAPAGTVSSSAQILAYNIFATTGSNTFTGNQLINKNGGEFQVTDPSNPQYGTTAIGISGASGGLIFKQSGSVLIEGSAGSKNLTFYGTGSFVKGIVISDNDFVAGATIRYDTTNDVIIIEKDGTYKPSLNIEGGLTASLENGYAWVGNASGRTVAVATSSFGGGGAGNFATTGSNTFTGDQTLIDNAGNFYTISDASGSMMLVAKGFTSASAHISASSAGIGNFIFKTNSNTATTTLSGSNNIFTNTGNPTAGFRRYLTSGNISMMGALPQISASMAFSPTISNNSFINAQATGNPLTIRGPISSSTYTINSNQIFNAVNIGSSAANNAEKIVAGISLNSNIIQTLSIVANRTNTTQTVSISNNQLQGNTTLNMNSSSIDLSTNLWYGTNTITNNSSGSSRVSAAGNAVGLVNNILLGTNTITFSGSNDPNDTQDLDYQGGMYRSMIIGTNTPFVQTGPTGSNSITNTAIIGNGLIVTGSSGNPVFGSDSLRHGSVFVGRFNDVSGNKDLTAETIFAVGTGTSTSARKTGFLIDSGSNTFVEGTFNVSGSTTLSGSLYIQSGSTLPSATGSSILTWNPTTGQVSQSPIATLISSSFSVGAFNSTVTQSGSAAVSQSMTYNNTDISNGVSIVSNSQITLANTGTYNIQFSAQLLAATGADTIWIWLKKNGTNVSNTATKLVLKNNEANVAAWNFVVPANASDYFELVWQSLDGHATLLTEAASGNYPAIPSIIVTVTQVE